MTQGMFERWHTGRYFSDELYHPASWVKIEMFSELDSESATLNGLLEDRNPWEAYYRLSSWLQALNKFVTYYNGEVGTHRSDVETHGPMVKFRRWIGENSSLISQIMAGIGAEYYSFTESPSGILVTVSFRPSSRGDAASQSASEVAETTSQPTDQSPIRIQPSGSRTAAPPKVGPTSSLRPVGFSPNDMRSNSFNPNNAAYTASQINRANQMNPNNKAYRLSRKSR